jgi:hypothetical protein
VLAHIARASHPSTRKTNFWVVANLQRAQSGQARRAWPVAASRVELNQEEIAPCLETQERAATRPHFSSKVGVTRLDAPCVSSASDTRLNPLVRLPVPSGGGRLC